MKNFSYSNIKTKIKAKKIAQSHLSLRSIQKQRKEPGSLREKLVFGALFILGISLVIYAFFKPFKVTQILSKWNSSSNKAMNLKSPRTFVALNIKSEKSVVKYKKSEILSDIDNRISDEFEIEELLKKRVGFWFDIYSKYSAHDQVIHDSRYPWVVYGVASAPKKYKKYKNLWKGVHKARSVARKKIQKIKSRLLKLSKRKSYKNLKGMDLVLYNKLKNFKGSRSKVFLQAYKNVRSQTGQKEFFSLGIKKSRKYLSEIEKVFESNGLPVELTRLPLVESSFNEKAVSKVGASGIWQLMPRTAKSYIKVTDHIDERRSPLKATVAAKKLLKFNYKVLKSWPLAVMAYNHGAMGIRNAVRKLKSKSPVKIISHYKTRRFSFASRNFYAEFLAAVYVEKYHREIFNDELNLATPLNLAVVELKKPIKIKKLTNILNMTSKELRALNPDLMTPAFKQNILLKEGFELYVPKDKHQHAEEHDLHNNTKTAQL